MNAVRTPPMMYLLIKSLHVCSVIFWIGGMLLQSLLLLAARSLPGPILPLELTRLRMLHQWDRTITIPAMMMTWMTGLFIATQGNWFGNHWLTLKLVIVIVLSAVHGMLAGQQGARVVHAIQPIAGG